MPEDFYTDGARLSPQVSAWIVDWGTLIVPAVVTALAFVLARVYRRLAHQREGGAPALSPGRAVVEGTVESLGGDERAVVTVEVVQEGTETHYKSQWTTTWKEVARRVDAMPFRVRLASGESVLVEPGEAPFLADELDAPVRVGEKKRTRSARLTPGETVQVSGVLSGATPTRSGAGAYREAGSADAWVMRPPKFGPMSLATRVTLSVFTERASVHRGFGVALAFVLAATHLLVLPGFHLLRAAGEVVDARLTHTRTHSEWVTPKNGSGHWVVTYLVRATAPRRGLALEDECSGDLYRAARSGTVRSAPFIVLGAWPSVHQIGPRPTIGAFKGVSLAVLMFAILCAYAGCAANTDPWYRRRRLLEFTPGKIT